MRAEPTVLVLGGGPAGLSVAIHLARAGVEVAVCERSQYARPQIGETLSPGVKPLLQALGAWSSFCRDNHLQSPGTVAVWTDNVPQESDFLFSPFGNGWHIDRATFDRSLAMRAEQLGVHVLRGGRPLAALRTTRGWIVQAQCEDQLIRYDCKFVVDATGRACWLGRRLESRKMVVDRLVGIVACLDSCHGGNQDRRLLLEAAECGWWYCAALPFGRVVAAHMTDISASSSGITDPLALWNRELRRTRHVRSRLSKLAPPTSVKCVSASSYRMRRVAGDDWIAVGDAAMAWDPLSSQGTVKALQDGAVAAAAIHAALQGDETLLADYERRATESFDTYCRIRDFYYGQVLRWPWSSFWSRRISVAATEVSGAEVGRSDS
jgi:flavin-dependent dehydrogenase